MVILVLDKDNVKVQVKVQVYCDGKDVGVVEGMMCLYGIDLVLKDNVMVICVQGVFMSWELVGDLIIVVDQLISMFDNIVMDGVMLNFDDYDQGLILFGEEILLVLWVYYGE